MKKLVLLFCIICFSNICVQAATDNVLQSIQIDTFKDTYNIVLKSDEKPEAKRVITDDNKMMLTLKGVRVSQELNTIYNATNIDSVTVEPAGNDTVNVSFQAQNISHANLVFDTLDTPLGVMRAKEAQAQKAQQQKPKKHKKKIVLSHPVRDYRPVFDEEDEEGMSLDSLMSNEYASSFISVFKEDGVTNTITILLIGLIILCVVRLFKRSNNEDNMQVGLSQSLRDREMGLMQDMMAGQQQYQAQQQMQQQAPSIRPEMTYGIRSYQNAVKTPYQQSIKSPYMTSEIRFNNSSLQQKMQEIRNNVQQQATRPNLQEKAPAAVASTPLRANKASQVGIQQRPVSSSSRMSAPQQRVTNMDSMKFLDSMAKIYEKNGRSDLAQGLKSKMNRI